MRMEGLGPLRVGEILDVAVKVYRERFGTLVRAVAVVVVPVAVLTGLVELSIPDSFTGGTTPADPFAPLDPGADPFDPAGDPLAPVDGGEVAAGLAGLLVSALLTWLATTLATAACFAIVSGAYLDRDTTWQGSLRFATTRLRPLLWLYVVYGLLLFLAFLALIVPGVYFFVAWAVAVPVLLFEDVRGRKALRRSRELLQGRWWATAAVLLLVTILAGIVQAAITGALVGVFAAGGGEVVSVVAGGAANAVSSMLTTPFVAAATTVLYFDALVRKEAFDLAQLAQGLEVEPRRDGGGAWPGSPPGSSPGDEAPPFSSPPQG